MSELLNTDNVTKEMKTVKRELGAMIKENQKLQSELRNRNDTINSLINKNFTELKDLQLKHQQIVDSLTAGYASNIKYIDEKNGIFQQSTAK